jgi:hypothetical protein
MGAGSRSISRRRFKEGEDEYSLHTVVCIKVQLQLDRTEIMSRAACQDISHTPTGPPGRNFLGLFDLICSFAGRGEPKVHFDRLQ